MKPTPHTNTVYEAAHTCETRQQTHVLHPILVLDRRAACGREMGKGVEKWARVWSIQSPPTLKPPTEPPSHSWKARGHCQKLEIVHSEVWHRDDTITTTVRVSAQRWTREEWRRRRERDGYGEGGCGRSSLQGCAVLGAVTKRDQDRRGLLVQLMLKSTIFRNP
jgi:hypothetical protein